MPVPTPHHAKPGLYAANPGAEAECAMLAIDLSGKTSLREVLEALGEKLDLPDWYGANFDALMDCLADPDWRPARQPLLLRGLRAFQLADPDNFATLLEVLRAATEERRASASPLAMIVDADLPGVPGFPGA